MISKISDCRGEQLQLRCQTNGRLSPTVGFRSWKTLAEISRIMREMNRHCNAVISGKKKTLIPRKQSFEVAASSRLRADLFYSCAVNETTGRGSSATSSHQQKQGATLFLNRILKVCVSSRRLWRRRQVSVIRCESSSSSPLWFSIQPANGRKQPARVGLEGKSIVVSCKNLISAGCVLWKPVHHI